MKLEIKTNGKFNKAKINRINGKIESIEFDFEQSLIWSDLELWLGCEKGNYLDHMSINVSKRNKLQAHK
nr:MAG TPA: hypothetical protein [Caudoviricetes sp.]